MKLKFTRKIRSKIIVFLLFFLIYKIYYQFHNVYNDDKISIIINIKNLTKEKHEYFNNIFMKLNSTRNFYFIQTVGQYLNENLNVLIENSTIKLVQSNFPDSIFLPLIVSLYGESNPEYILFIEGDDLYYNNKNELLK